MWSNNFAALMELQTIPSTYGKIVKILKIR